MNDYTLSQDELTQLRAAHVHAREKRYADRLKAVILLGSGWSAQQVAEALMMDPDTVRSYFKQYKKKGTHGLLYLSYRGGVSWLSDEQFVELNLHLRQTLYLSARPVVDYVRKHYGVHYSERGMRALLHRLGYVYKKPKLVPGKADAQAQRAFVEQYEKLKENKGEADVIYFMDATHPHHNPVLGHAWIRRGIECIIPSNTGRDRLNINGAIELESMRPVVRFDASINATSTVALFEQIEQIHPGAKRIHIICDNARYYRSKEVIRFLENSKIELMFLPPYSPNLNLIERFWKFFKKKVIYNTYYKTFDEFRAACGRFFQNSSDHIDSLRSLLTEKFEIIEI